MANIEKEFSKYSYEILSENNIDYNISFKIIIIGDSGVGKSFLTGKAINKPIGKEYSATVGKEYQKHIKDSVPEIAISEIRRGSQIYELIVVSSLVLYPEIMQYTIVDFFTYLQRFTERFLNTQRIEDLICTRKDCKNVKSLTDMFNDDAKLSLEIETLKNNEPIKHTEISNEQGNLIRQRAIIKLQNLEAEKTNIFENVLLQFYQTRNVNCSSPGDKAIIPSICEKPHKILFTNDEIKRTLMEENTNIYLNLYRAYGTVEYKGDKVKLYNIDRIELSDTESNDVA
jgi:ABC-type dipeptide/oligopeptide/nickel transport system ATPase component